MSENEYQEYSSLVKLTHVLLLFRERAKTDSQNSHYCPVPDKNGKGYDHTHNTHMPVAEMKYQDIQYLVFMYDRLRSYLNS